MTRRLGTPWDRLVMRVHSLFFIASGAAEDPPIGSRAGVIHPGTDKDRPNGKHKYQIDNGEVEDVVVFWEIRIYRNTDNHVVVIDKATLEYTCICTRCLSLIKDITNARYNNNDKYTRQMQQGYTHNAKTR